MKKERMENAPLLKVEDLSVSFHMYDKGLEQYDLKVISNLSLDVKPGEIVAIAGSSGSGKSLLAHAVMGILPENARLTGSITYKGEILDQKKKEAFRGTRIALVPQSIAYLDPLMKVGKQVTGGDRGKEAEISQREIFKRFHLDEKIEKYYPFQLSGGMARRVLVSTAVISDASLIIADEPTPGLDLEMALEALKVFRELATRERQWCSSPMTLTWPFILLTGSPYFMPEPQWRWQGRKIFWRVRESCAIHTPKHCGRHFPRTASDPFRDFSHMPGICQRDVSFLQDVPIRQKSVKMIFP